jgi:hypothetical protein
VNARELRTMISKIVAEEVGRQLPTIAARVITETFIRKIVSESTARKSVERPLAEVLEEPEEEAPEPMNNADKGIYHKSPLVKEEREALRSQIRSRLLDDDNPMRALYEGVDPVPSGPAATPNGGRGIPIEKMGVDPDMMRKLMGAPPARQIDGQDAKMKIADLERRRKMLDVPASEWRGE